MNIRYRRRRYSGLVNVVSVTTEKTRIDIVDSNKHETVSLELDTWQWARLAATWWL